MGAFCCHGNQTKGQITITSATLDGQKVITIAHPEHSSGELKKGDKRNISVKSF